jgi:DNA-binding beta-propeller fold protein YncE
MVIPTLAFSMFLATFTARADAAGGLLRFSDCIATFQQASNCVDLTPQTTALDPTSLTISPNGRDVYVTGRDAAIHLVRDSSTGSLAFGDCLSGGAFTFQGCTNVHPDPVLYNYPLQSPGEIALSPDGAYAYSADGGSDGLSRFMRAPSGALSFGGCLTTSDFTTGCSYVSQFYGALDAALRIAISPDGASIYAGAAEGHDVAHFHRDLATGSMELDGCIAASKDVAPYATVCTDLSNTTNALTDVDSLAVSPDGRNLYVTAGYRGYYGVFGTISTFALDRNGKPTFAGCITASMVATSGCSDLTATTRALEGVAEVAMSPDGRDLYTAGWNAGIDRPSRNAGSLAHFRRDPNTGALSFAGCVSSRGAANGCTELDSNALDGAVSVTVSADGFNVYVASSKLYVGAPSNAIVTFARKSTTGDLRFESCTTGGPSPATGCADIVANEVAFYGLRGIRTSPDGKSVYAVSPDRYAVLHFQRDPATDESDTTRPSNPRALRDTVAPKLTRVSVSPRRFSVGTRSMGTWRRGHKRYGTKFRYQLSEAARVKFSIERRVRAQSNRPCAKAQGATVTSRRCSRWHLYGIFERSRRAGRHKDKFSGWIGTKKLTAGSYRAVLKAEDAAGNRSKAAAVTFRVVR